MSSSIQSTLVIPEKRSEKWVNWGFWEKMIRSGDVEGFSREAAIKISRHPAITTDILIFLYRLVMADVDNIPIRIALIEICLVAERYQEALMECEELHESHPFLPECIKYLARIYPKVGVQNRGLVKIFESAIENNFFDDTVITILDQIYLRYPDPDKGLKLYRRLTEVYPEHVGYQLALAEYRVKAFHLDEAANQYFDLAIAHTGQINNSIHSLTKILPMQFSNQTVRERLIQLYIKACLPLEALPLIKEWCLPHSKQLQKAIDYYKQLLSIYPHTIEVMLDLAYALMLAEQLTECVSHLREIFSTSDHHDDLIYHVLIQVVERCHEQIMGWQLLAELHFRNHRHSDALDCLAQLLTLEFDEIEMIESLVNRCKIQSPALQDRCILLLAQCCVKRGQFPSVFKLCDQLEIGPFACDALLLKVSIHQQKHEYAAAIGLLIGALNGFSTDARVHSKLNELQDLKLSAGIESASTPVYERGLLQLRRGSAHTAISEFQLVPEADTHYNSGQLMIGRSFLQMGRFDLAISQLDRLLSSGKPVDTKTQNQTLYLKSLCYTLSGQTQSALKAVETILETDINFPEINTIIPQIKAMNFVDVRGKTLALLYRTPSKTEMVPIVVPNIENERTRRKNLPNIGFSQDQNNAGVTFTLQQNINAAGEALHLANQMDPSLTAIHINLAIVGFLTGNFKTSKSHLEFSKTLSPKLDLIEMGYGYLALFDNQIEDAIGLFQKAYHLNPSNLALAVMIGDLFFKTGDINHALVYWFEAFAAFHLRPMIQDRIRHLDGRNWSLDEWIRYH